MAIHRTTDSDVTTLTFVLGEEADSRPVSVVGSFNDWTPGADVFEATPDGVRAVTITVPAQVVVHFRYLATDGFWFDEPAADEITDEGSFIRPESRLTASSE